jgi:asparagine synthase (glutamine-hydrolysing)
MCGITGIIHFGRQPDAPTRLRPMTDAIAHRGPDDEGFWSNGDASFGFRRLAIVDIDSGEQPMSNEDGSVWIVYNGEIYNHRELRRELERHGHRFKSDHSDTEVLVHGWEQWGERLPERLNGMFAFSIYDHNRRCVLLGRDRYGIKPLYLATLANGSIVFGSEVRAIHASGLVPIDGDPESIVAYFSLMNFWHGRTPFRKVSMLSPGSTALVAAGSRKDRRYWDFKFERRTQGNLKFEENRFRATLAEAIKRQVAADVPVMTYLSGGIDSSAVTAAAHRVDPQMRAYSCIFALEGVGDDKFVDEREFSRAVATNLGIDRVELTVQQDDLTRLLDSTIEALEYPRMGMAYVNYLIAGRVAQDAKVVLSGMGGDEVTGGYVSRYGLVPHLLGRKAPLWKRFLPGRGEAPAVDPFDVYRRMLNVVIPVHELATAFTPEVLSAAKGFDPIATINNTIDEAPAEDSWDKVMYVDATTYLHGLLVLEDKLSMAHSLETRVPLLDNEVVDLLLKTPWSLLTDGETGKILFREAVRPWVPELVANKPKMGFGPPDASWYRGKLRPWIERMLSPRIVSSRGVFNPAYVARKLEEHFSGAANHVALIWCLLSFESWCRQYRQFGGDLRAVA